MTNIADSLRVWDSDRDCLLVWRWRLQFACSEHFFNRGNNFLQQVGPSENISAREPDVALWLPRIPCRNLERDRQNSIELEDILHAALVETF
jgi:hypothetical protein